MWINIYVFVIGLVIGSFLNVCIYRIPSEETVSFPPSHCGSCGKRLKAYDLVPVFSYIFLKGHCRYCKEKISVQYPIIELITGILFSLFYYVYGLIPNFVSYCFFISVMIVIAAIDFKTRNIYFNTIITGIAGGVIFLIYCFIYKVPVYDKVIAAAAGYGLIALVILLSKGGMGWGDAEICFVCGLFMGLKLMLLTLFLACLIGAAASIFMIAVKHKNRKDAIAFGPYIAAASIVSLLYGNSIIIWYINNFLMI